MTVVGEQGVGSEVDTRGEEVERIQKRTVRVLLLSQATGGVGLVATYIVTAVLAKSITHSRALATVAAACLSIGAAAVSYPLSRQMSAKGRRVGLRTGYLIGACGAIVALLGAITRSYPILCLGVLGAGAGNASNLATRYAATDLASPQRRARTISVVVWTTTIGSTAGSVISGFASNAGESLGLPAKGGSYLLSGLMFLLAAGIVEMLLRPDPLVVAGGIGKVTTHENRPRVMDSARLIWNNPTARVAAFAMIVCQVTMVGVMSLTPLHMDEGGQSQTVIGLMMAFHIWGMYLLSPVVGTLADRIGHYPMLYIAGALCTAGALWAATTPSDGRVGVFAGNFLVGLGWSFGIVAASSLIVEQFPIEQRVGVQGVGDMAMIGAGAFAGVSSGALYSIFGYGGVNFGNAAFGILLIFATTATISATRTKNAIPVS